jgi:hypothetical protein
MEAPLHTKAAQRRRTPRPRGDSEGAFEVGHVLECGVSAPLWYEIHRRVQLIASILLLTLFTRALPAAEPIRFLAMDLIIDPKGQPLAAYQVEIQAEPGVKIVGVEGGEHAEFRKAPYYDPKGIQTERLIVAAFSTAEAEALPKAATRVLTLHLQTTISGTPKLETSLKVAAKPNGQKIKAETSLTERKAP